MKTLTGSMLLLAAVLLFSCSPEPADNPVGFDRTSKAVVIHDLPLRTRVYNECCDEMINLSGTGRIVVNDNGRHHFFEELIGVTASGNTYKSHGPAIQHFATDVHPDGTVTDHFIAKIRMIGDNGCSFYLTIKRRTIMHPDGMIEIAFEQVDVDCE